MNRLILVPVALTAFLSASFPTLAHTGVDDTHGFVHGFLHPISGLDHTLAMVAVGLFAAHIGGKALWLLPTTFVMIMAVGGVLGMNGINIPYVEIGIAASVIAFGLMIALQVPVPAGLAMALVGFFAIFHGHAHGSEMPASSSGFSYAAGFMLATATLHAIGIAAGLAILKASRSISMRLAQIVGGMTAAAGVGLLGGWI